MGKYSSPCCEKIGLKKGPWTLEEDKKLLAYIQEHGHGSWRALPTKAGLQRCGKSCRLRWTNYLRPDIKRGQFSFEEEQTIIQLHALLGNRWSAIARNLSKRTDNEIKNYWNTHLKKRFTKMGIDPMTHKPKNYALSSGQPKDMANLNHMAQWESARLEAEARIVRESKLASNPYHAQLLNNATTIALPSLVPPTVPVQSPCLDILKVWRGGWTNPRKDTSSMNTGNGYFTPSRTLKSPSTFVLNSSGNMPMTISTLEKSFGYVGNSNSCTIGRSSTTSYQDDEVRGIMDNSMTLRDITDPIPNFSNHLAADSLEFPSFMDDFTYHDLPPIIGENKNIDYWSNVLNIATSPMGSPVF